MHDDEMNQFHVSTHSRPKAAGNLEKIKELFLLVSTHSRPKAAGFYFRIIMTLIQRFNTQPPEGGWALEAEAEKDVPEVSTHSRPKAAGRVKKTS